MCLLRRGGDEGGGGVLGAVIEIDFFEEADGEPLSVDRETPLPSVTALSFSRKTQPRLLGHREEKAAQVTAQCPVDASLKAGGGWPVMEIERKFLLKSPPRGWRKSSGCRIRQGYFALRRKDVEIRLRQRGNDCFVTIKAGRGRVRLEEEIRISKPRFETLWPLVRDTCVVKTRYVVPCAGREIELDVYEGRNRGLITADVEFPTKMASRSFSPPAWLGREITGKRRYANESLARRGSK